MVYLIVVTTYYFISGIKGYLINNILYFRVNITDIVIYEVLKNYQLQLILVRKY